MMMKRLLVLCFTGAMCLSLGAAPAEARQPAGDIYEKGSYNDPYEFEDDSCGFLFEVKGRSRGFFINYNVPDSDGQAFLNHNWYRFRDVLTNPANGRKAYISGRGYFREVGARHVEGNIWEFDSDRERQAVRGARRPQERRAQGPRQDLHHGRVRHLG